MEDEDPGEGKGSRTKMMRTEMKMTRRAEGEWEGRGHAEKTEERKENEEAEEDEDDNEDRKAEEEGEANGRIKGTGSRSGRKLLRTSRMRRNDVGAERTQEEAACGAKEAEKMGREDAAGHAAYMKTPVQVMHLSKLVSTPVRGVTWYCSYLY